MNNYNLNLAESLFVTFLILIFAIWFLITLEIIRSDGNFRGIKGIVLSLLIAASIITTPILILQIGYNPQETTRNSYFIIVSDLYPEVILILIGITLNLIVIAAVRFARDKDDDPDNEITELTEKSHDEKLSKI